MWRRALTKMALLAGIDGIVYEHNTHGALLMTSSNGNIFCVIGHLCGEFTGDRWIPHTKASDAELWCFGIFYQRVNKRWSKQSWGWWFETLSSPLWRHCNVILCFVVIVFPFLWIQEFNSSPNLQNDRLFANNIIIGIFVIENFVYWLKFPWSLFLRVLLTIAQHWFR